MAKNYTSINNIKNMVMTQIAPKYFDNIDHNELNVGLLGYMTDVISTIAEDGLNTTTAYMNEIFPHLATLPETINNNASLFKIDGFFGTPAVCKIFLFIPEESIQTYATRVSQSSNFYEFFIDSDMTIDIEGIRFKPDYNIRISYKKYKNEYVYTAMYDTKLHGTTYKNTLSDITNPYIKVNRINYERVKYLQLEITTRQIDKYFLEETVVNGGILNLPTYEISFDDHMASFEIFYKEAGSSSYIQIDKLKDGSSPIKKPFCYYNMVDENKLEITFTPRDGYFQPAYNSEFIIDYYTTTGVKGNFESYSGTNIVVSPSSDIYDYNNGLSMFALPVNGAFNGSDPLTQEQLRMKTVEKFSTTGAYNNENDLQVYFDNVNVSSNSKLYFIKKRDDIFNRTFSSFSLLKDSSDEFIHTNTLKLHLDPDDFDSEYEQSDIYILKPGHVFTYETGFTDKAKITPSTMITNMSSVTSDFIFTNPFLIYFAKNPTSIGYYINSINKTYNVDYIEVNDGSLVQFICNNLKITRNAHLGESSYTVKLSIMATSELDNPMVTINETTNVATVGNSIKVRLFLTNNGVDECYTDMTLTEYDLDSNIYTFTGTITTDDYINENNKFRVTNMTDTSGNTGNQFLVDMIESIVKISIFYKYSGATEYTKTNSYSTETNTVDFIYPLLMVDSTVTYVDNMDGEINPETGLSEGGTYSILIDSSPVVRASTLADSSKSQEFYNAFNTQYSQLSDVMTLITNNFSIDMKFYNTYGKSHNFYVGDDLSTRLDRVNIGIKFKVSPVFGNDYDELVRDLSIFIKDYIESINSSGTNSIYISNLIREIENNFDSVSYLKFVSFNNYSSAIQVIENTTVDLASLSIEDRKHYVPEYLTLSLDDVNIELI